MSKLHELIAYGEFLVIAKSAIVDASAFPTLSVAESVQKLRHAEHTILVSLLFSLL